MNALEILSEQNLLESGKLATVRGLFENGKLTLDVQGKELAHILQMSLFVAGDAANMEIVQRTHPTFATEMTETGRFVRVKRIEFVVTVEA